MSKEIPIIKKAESGTSIPENYSTTPSGTIYTNTPGGTRIIYDRNTLLNLANSPLAKTPPTKLAYIPGVTIPHQTTDHGSSEENDTDDSKKLNQISGHLAPPNPNYPGFKNTSVDSNQNVNINSGGESGDEDSSHHKQDDHDHGVFDIDME